MKAVLLFSLVAVAICDDRVFSGFQRGPPTSFGSSRSRFSPPQNPQPVEMVDATLGRSLYYFSWRHDGGVAYTGTDAARLCTSLGNGWQAVGISSQEEIDFIIAVVAGERLQYIWTGGVRTQTGFIWLNGEPFIVDDWSSTGGLGRRQPDNRESGNENCLAVLNFFYNDGVKWHDVACHHLKPVICEKHT
ncbi:uncharacterized protein [Cherax quadricarinatus]|uniref:uncharacterized protein n=1 Tax=Cherax quadricarinatus TaxID=27406 RepID=UPI00387E5586